MNKGEFIRKKNKEFKEDKSKKIRMKDIGRKTKMFFIREAWTFMPQYNLEKKVFVIERLRKCKTEKRKMAYPKAWQKGEIEYRFGYYIVGQIRKAKNRWVWGQFCPIIPQKDFNRLINKAKKEKTIL